MNYTNYSFASQSNTYNHLIIPSLLNGFNNTHTSTIVNKNNKFTFIFEGFIDPNTIDFSCPHCHKKMHINNHLKTLLKHLPIGNNYSCISISRPQLFCPSCHFSMSQYIPFKSDKHFITSELYNYISDLLALGMTNKSIAFLSGVNKNIVKDIDKDRLNKLYTVDGLGYKLKTPDHYSSFLAIDEFKLHNGYKYATHIIDLESGHVLWIAEGKKKNVVYDFINFVGLEWMSHVKGIACDMNSDFEEAFIEKCPHLDIVYDYFHIIKNFNDSVLNNVRKDEIHRLTLAGLVDELTLIKKSKYILLSNKSTLEKKDALNKKKNNSINTKSLFNQCHKTYRTDNLERYNNIIRHNKLLFIADYIKEELKFAYSENEETLMLNRINHIINTCNNTKNEHFIKFAILLKKHLYGIVSHAKYHISSGKIEGINNKIKTIRRQSYGLPDDEYFFLKIFDASRHSFPQKK